MNPLALKSKTDIRIMDQRIFNHDIGGNESVTAGGKGTEGGEQMWDKERWKEEQVWWWEAERVM